MTPCSPATGIPQVEPINGTKACGQTMSDLRGVSGEYAVRVVWICDAAVTPSSGPTDGAEGDN